ncbi:MAG: hypothetical protein U0J93_02195 [Parolsenella sp.]|uniref:hypothetical protein n=1 Tax=Parolsenella sp. TaxID=2083006 RepID=UPI002E766311|nr:hypothetical protein [Parolsenella sp.]MEE1372175.1 hypothetical protein [Parolsenella sp.]
MLDEDGNPTGGYTRRLTFGDVNGGVNWVGDDAARLEWGRWDAGRTAKVHRFGQVTFSDCEDADELLALTKAALVDAVTPKVSYEVDVALIDGGVPVFLGDDVAVIYSSRAPEWRLTARCVKRVREFGQGARRQVTLCSVERAVWTVAAETVARVTKVEETAESASDTVVAYPDLSTKEY